MPQQTAYIRRTSILYVLPPLPALFTSWRVCYIHKFLHCTCDVPLHGQDSLDLHVGHTLSQGGYIDYSAKVCGPQISSANRKSVYLRT
jgi:hypothetical protein